MYVCVCPSRPGRRRIPVAELYHLPRESRIGPSLCSFPPFSLVRFTRPEVHALPTFPELVELVATAGRSLDYALLALPPPPTRASSVSLSTSYLPLASLSVSLSVSMSSRASLLLPLQIPRFGVSVPLLEIFPLPLDRLLLLFPQYLYPSRSTWTSSRRFPSHVASSSSLRVTPLSRECSPVLTGARSPSKILYFGVVIRWIVVARFFSIKRLWNLGMCICVYRV